MFQRIVTLFIACLFSVLAFAADPAIYSHKSKGAIKGADPVAYFSLEPGAKAVIGSKDITYEWKGARWHFASESNKALFIADPEKYAPEYGGYCAYAASLDFTTSIKPNSWTIINGKLYLNYNRVSQRKFLKAPLQKITRADKNWPDLLSNCERKDNCRKY